MQVINFSGGFHNVCQLEENRTRTGQIVLRDAINEYHTVAMNDFGDLVAVNSICRAGIAGIRKFDTTFG